MATLPHDYVLRASVNKYLKDSVTHLSLNYHRLRAQAGETYLCDFIIPVKQLPSTSDSTNTLLQLQASPLYS